MSAALNNVTAPDEYDATSLLLCLNTARVRLQVFNQGIYWRRGFSPPGGQGVWWEPEEFVAPNVFSLNERCDYLQFRAAIPASEIPEGQNQAQVTIATRTLNELNGKNQGQ
jgi:hypothetical protein